MDFPKSCCSNVHAAITLRKPSRSSTRTTSANATHANRQKHRADRNNEKNANSFLRDWRFFMRGYTERLKKLVKRLERKVEKVQKMLKEC